MRKGYFFVIDSIIALLIMTLGVVLVFSYFMFSQSSQQASVTSDDVLGLLNVKIRNLNNAYCGVNSNLTRDRNITNMDNTIVEQLAEFHYRNLTKSCAHCRNLTWRVIDSVTSNVPLESNFMVNIANRTVFFRNQTPIESARVIIPSRKIVQCLYNGTESAGPYLAEVFVWQ